MINCNSDGGGVRGLSTLLMLQALMERVNEGREERLKPCQIFDVICGTSTGGLVLPFLMLRCHAKIISLIAIMIGRLEMDVSDCIKAYISMFSRIFEKKAHWLSFNWKGNLQARFDSNVLRQCIVEIVTSRPNLTETTRFNDGTKRSCHTFAHLFPLSSIYQSLMIV
jgi:hypothetical protein